MSEKPLTKIQAKAKILQLKAAAYAYYNSGTPVMSDGEFDAMYAQVKKAIPEHDFFKSIGAPAIGEKVKHEIPMTSLDNAFELEEIAKFLGRLPGRAVVLQPKMDGLSIELVYKNCHFHQAITSGDGIVGEDVTHTLTNSDIPHELPPGSPDTLSVRGEVMVKIMDWKVKLKDKANPRNACAGLVRRHDAKGSELLKFHAFDVVGHPDGEITESRKIEYLNSLGFTVVSCALFDEPTPQRIQEFYDKAVKNRKNAYEKDGLVIKFNNANSKELLGESGGGMRPKYAIAYKFPGAEVSALVKGVTMQVGRTGVITPVADLEPVECGGVMVDSPTLHNFDFIEELDLHVGDTVKLVRSGDVIPKVISVISQGQDRIKIERPSECPVCSSPSFIDGAFTKCSNEMCPARKSMSLYHWVKQRNILHLGKKISETLSEKGITVPDLYTMDTEKLAELIGSYAIASKIIPEIEKTRQCTLSDLLGSVGIAGFGKSEAESLVENGWDTPGKIFGLQVGDLCSTVAGYKEAKDKKIITSIHAHKQLLNDLLSVLTLVDPAKEDEAVDGPLGGDSFCLTGKFSCVKKDLEAKIKEKGGVIGSKVADGLSYLVQADPSSTSSKTKKAQKLGIQIISEQELLALL